MELSSKLPDLIDELDTSVSDARNVVKTVDDRFTKQYESFNKVGQSYIKSSKELRKAKDEAIEASQTLQKGAQTHLNELLKQDSLKGVEEVRTAYMDALEDFTDRSDEVLRKVRSDYKIGLSVGSTVSAGVIFLIILTALLIVWLGGFYGTYWVTSHTIPTFVKVFMWIIWLLLAGVLTTLFAWRLKLDFFDEY